MKLIFISYFDCGIKIVSSVKKRSGSDNSQSFWLVNFKKILSSVVKLFLRKKEIKAKFAIKSVGFLWTTNNKIFISICFDKTILYTVFSENYFL